MFLVSGLPPKASEEGTLSHDARPAFCLLTVVPADRPLTVAKVHLASTNPQRRSGIGRLIKLSSNQIRTPSITFPRGTRGLSGSRHCR